MYDKLMDDAVETYMAAKNVAPNNPVVALRFAGEAGGLAEAARKVRKDPTLPEQWVRIVTRIQNLQTVLEATLKR